MIYQSDTGIDVTVFLCAFGLGKISNRTYVPKSWYAKHGLGYCDLVHSKWQTWP